MSLRRIDAENQPGLALLEPLDSSEKRELAQHEAIIKRYAEAYADVGEALLAIRDQRLYRETHKTFEAYCDERLGFTKGHANHLIKSVAVVKNLASIDVKPKNLAQTRPLARLKPDQQKEAWAVAREKAAGKEVTAFDLEQAAAMIAPKVVAKPIENSEEKKERMARAKKNRERREKQQAREQAEREKAAREAWEKDIVAVQSPVNPWHQSRKIGRDVESAIISLSKQGVADGDTALFRGGRLLAVVIFKDGSSVVVRRDEIERGDN